MFARLLDDSGHWEASLQSLFSGLKGPASFPSPSLSVGGMDEELEFPMVPNESVEVRGEEGMVWLSALRGISENGEAPAFMFAFFENWIDYVLKNLKEEENDGESLSNFGNNPIFPF